MDTDGGHLGDGAAHIRIVIAGGHPVVRGAVRLSCIRTEGLAVVEESDDVTAIAEICARLRPHLLVLDVDGTPDGLTGMRALRERGLDTPVLVLTDRTDGASVLAALKLGVRGYLGKADGLRRVGDAIRRIADGDRLVAPDLEEAAVMALGRFARQAREGSSVAAALTPREQQILRLISEGHTMHQVGSTLGISPRTVETHVAKLYRKLGVRTRVQAVSRAAQLGLIDIHQAAASGNGAGAPDAFRRAPGRADT
jgi:DNA-binding NarL/FixJ family response regulator